MTLPTGLGLIAFGYQSAHRQLDDAIHEFESGRIHLQESYQATREFFNFAQRDPHFFETGESEYLAARQSALENARATLTRVHQKLCHVLDPIHQVCIPVAAGKLPALLS